MSKNICSEKHKIRLVRKMSKSTNNNHKEIIAVLRNGGVQPIDTIGRGCPDILVGFQGVNCLLVLKLPSCQLMPDEKALQAPWRG